MTQESIDMTPNYDAIPFKERLDFQLCLMKIMLGPDFEHKSKEEQLRVSFEWADKYQYAKKVSEIIDDPKNEAIRNLILIHEYEQASDLIIPMLLVNIEDQIAA